MTTYRCTSSIRNLLLALGLVLTAGLLTLPSGSFAQSTANDTSPLVQHLQKKLQSNDHARRESALVDVIALATCPSTCTLTLQSVKKKKKAKSFMNMAGTGYTVDLNALVPHLLEAYRSGPADGHRLLALSALINIGDAAALEQLVEEGARRSNTVNDATQRSLAAYYLQKYPSLRTQAMRSGRIGLDDVRRAEVIRVKRMQKAAKEKS